MALRFTSASDQYVSIPNAPELNPLNEITLMGWARIVDKTKKCVFIQKAYTSDASPYYQYSLNTDGQNVYLTFDGGSEACGGAVTYNDGDVLFVVGRYKNDGSGMLCDVWKNGLYYDQFTLSRTGTIDVFATPLYIGRFANTTDRSSADVWDCRVYNRKLTDAELRTIHAGKGVDDVIDGLVGRWKMDEATEGETASGATIVDASKIILHRRAVFHSKLGANGDITSPVIGGAGDITGTMVFDAVKFGNGAGDNNSLSNVAKFPNPLSSAEIMGQWAIEAYWKAPVNWDYATSPTNRVTIFSLSDTGTYETPLAFGYNADPGGNNFSCYSFPYPGTGAGYRFVPVAFTAGDIIHLLVIVDLTAGAGKKFRVFQNGVELTATPVTDNTPTFPFSHTLYLYVGWRPNGWTMQGGYADNLKVYNYPKVGAVDRFREFEYVGSKTQLTGTAYNSPVYRAAPVRLFKSPHGRA